MKRPKVRVVNMAPMRVVSFRAISETPEHDAWDMLRQWAEPRGLLKDPRKHPVFGFNNPDPSPNSKEYGYEFWIRIDENTELEGGVQAREFAGGMYAVTTCDAKESTLEAIPQAWKMLADWVESGMYKFGRHQMLEKIHKPGVPDSELVLDLYCPIEPKYAKISSARRT